MTLSWDGCLALGAIVTGGPLLWALWMLAQRKMGQSTSDLKEQIDHGDAGEGSPGREMTDGLSYLMTLLGYAIGIGNLWRFPYLVGKWGGGAFVLAYLTSLVFIAAPLYMMELGMGHYTRRSTLDCFRLIHPRWVGLAIGQSLMIFICLTYFNVLIAYCGVYVVSALKDPLPWSPEAMFNQLPVPTGADTAVLGRSAAQLFWVDHVLNKYPGSLEGLGLGGVQLNLVLSLAFVWLLVFLALAFGKKVLAQVTWVTVIGPVILLAFFLFQALRLPGAWDGVHFYIGKFDTQRLGDIELWATACSQILFSLSPGFGTAVTMTSYTDPKTNVIRTCLTVAFCNSAFSLTGGFAIFGILGNLALRTGRTVADVASASGPGLAFIAIADGMRTFGPFANAMAVFFFVMLMSLGLDSTFAWVETLVSIIEDYLHSRGRKVSTKVIVGSLCLTLFVLGIPFCTRMGGALLDVVDHYVGSMFLLLACCVEVFMFNVGYKFRRLTGGLRISTGQNLAPEFFWRFCYMVPVPLGTGGLFMYLMYSAVKRPYGGYPHWLQGLGWTLLGTCVLCMLSTIAKKGKSSLVPFDTNDEDSDEMDSSDDSDAP